MQERQTSTSNRNCPVETSAIPTMAFGVSRFFMRADEIASRTSRKAPERAPFFGPLSYVGIGIGIASLTFAVLLRL